jgi:hypothetical protein
MSPQPRDTNVVPDLTTGAVRQVDSQPAQKRHPELRLAILTLLLPLYLSVAVATNYIGAFHAPKPHHVKVAIVGVPASTAPLAHELSLTSPNGFDVSRVVSVSRARRLVGERALAGAYLPSSRPPTVIVATAASASLAGFVEATFRQVVAAQGRPLAIDDVRPLPANNPSGVPNYFFIVICTLGGFLTVAALGLVAPTLPEYHRFAVAGAASLLAPIIGYVIGGPGYGTFSASLATIIAMLGLGALYAFAVATTTRLLQLGLGARGTLVASLLFIFLNFPTAGGSVAPQLLPGFWRFLNHFWIGAAALDANRSTLYFGGAGVGTDVLKMLAWPVAWAAVVAVPIYLRNKRKRGNHVSATPAAAPQTVVLASINDL